jgi:general secretion pathway protein D
VRPRDWSLVVVVTCAVLLAGCAAGRAFRRGETAAAAGDWDAAVAHLTRAVQEAPDKPEYKAALERASYFASRVHSTKARELEEKGDLHAALAEYRRAIEYDGTNRPAIAKAAELEARIRERAEAQRPPSKVEQMREEARRRMAEPILNPSSREPLNVRFTNASLRDILNFIGGATGINVTFDQQFQDRPYSVELVGVTLEQALNQIMRANTLFYKVIDERTILVIPDNPQNRAKYEEQVIRTFYLSHADATEVSQIINTVIRVPQMAVTPAIFPNKTANTITVRATTAVADVIERIIRANDKPRAEVIVDVAILEVNRSRAKQYGLSLNNYAISSIFSPEVAPPNVAGAVTAPPPFNVNTVSQGVSTADFYLAVPYAVVKFLESDSRTKVIAKPQLRGAEGTKLSLNLGEEVPVLSTVFGAAAAGGIATVPTSSYNYRPIGIIVEMTPRVTYDGEIILDLTVESSTLGGELEVGGQKAPRFGTRKVTTRLRLREGESNLLAGLLREDERKSLTGFPGLMRLPILRQLFSSNDETIDQTDIVMLLTPHIVRTHELTQEDLNPIFIGTQQNIGLTGPPPLIAPVPETEAVPAAPPAAPVVPPGLPTKPEVPPGAPTFPVPTAQPPAAPTPAPPPTPPTAPPEPVVTPAPAEAARPAEAAQVLVTPPGTEWRLGTGPYTVPISISGASRVSVVSVSLTYNPGVLRVRTVQEGTFMRQGGVTAVFSHTVDQAAGRVDLAVTRVDDQTGASGTGLIAAVLFEPVAAGESGLTASGVATSPDGKPVPLRFAPVTVTVK